MSYPIFQDSEEIWDKKYYALTTYRDDFESVVVQPSFQTTPFRLNPNLPRRRKQSSLGKLDVLPVETIQDIIIRIDLFTVTNLRRLNTRMRAIIDSTAPFRLLAEYASGGLRTLIHVGVASYFSVAQVFQVMCTSTCIVCGQNGTYLYMPECTRCCLNCLSVAQELMPICKTEAKLAFGLTEKTLRDQNVPVVISLPGHYTYKMTARLQKLHLMSQRLIHEVATTVHGGEDGLNNFLIDNPRAYVAFKKQMAQADERSHDYWGYTPNNIRRYMATTSFPFYDCATRRVYDGGYSCRGCQITFDHIEDSSEDSEWVQRQNDTYTEEGFIAHFDLCPSVQKLHTGMGGWSMDLS